MAKKENKKLISDEFWNKISKVSYEIEKFKHLKNIAIKQQKQEEDLKDKIQKDIDEYNEKIKELEEKRKKQLQERKRVSEKKGKIKQEKESNIIHPYISVDDSMSKMYDEEIEKLKKKDFMESID